MLLSAADECSEEGVMSISAEDEDFKEAVVWISAADEGFKVPGVRTFSELQSKGCKLPCC